ncbi:unnamed protein product [Allacma fusca]|uniref:Uncharacterized protein n=1 Tax=Allacma fusca TaxID=39272 RepID=A0A8J2K5V0_9HEXA|nr:unnamed protein product [Allacma fusca]
MLLEAPGVHREGLRVPRPPPGGNCPQPAAALGADSFSDDESQCLLRNLLFRAVEVIVYSRVLDKSLVYKIIFNDKIACFINRIFSSFSSSFILSVRSLFVRCFFTINSTYLSVTLTPPKMDKWMNVAGRAGTGAAIAGVSMTYYALMRRNAEIEKESQTQEIVLPQSDEDILEASKESLKKTDDDEDSKTKSETLSDGKDHANGNFYEENTKNVSSMLRRSEMGEFSADSLTDSECILSGELPWFTQSSKSLSKSSKDKLNGNILDPPLESKKDVESTSATHIFRNDEDLNVLYSSSSSSLHEGNDYRSTAVESCPEPREPPPILKLSSSGCVEPKCSVEKESVPVTNNSELISLEYIPRDSWIAWPLKFFPARYINYILATMAMLFWIVCAVVTYCLLEFCYYSLGWKQSQILRAKPVSAITEAQLDVTKLEDNEHPVTTSHWHCSR